MSNRTFHLSEGKWIPIGKILAPWGVRGASKFILYNPQSKVLEVSDPVYVKIDSSFEPLSLISARPQGKFLILHFRGYSSPEAVLKLKGKEVFIPVENLPPKEKGEIYIFELVGMTVYSSQGKKLGRVERVENYGASEILVVKNSEDEKDEILIPMIPNLLKEILLSEKKIILDPPEGLF